MLVASLCGLGHPAAAEVYRWIGDDGQLNYGDAPPRGVASERLALGVPEAAAVAGEAAASPAPIAGQEAGSPGGTAAGTAAADAAGPARMATMSPRERQCLEARMRIAMLREQLPIFRDTQGKLHVDWRYDSFRGARQYINDLTRNAEIARAGEVVASSCDHPDDPAEQALARKRWMMSQYCARQRAALAAAARPEARTPDDELDARRDMVARYCAD